MAPSVDDLKSVTSTLWDVMDISGRFLERTPLHRDVLNFGEPTRIVQHRVVAIYYNEYYLA